ncbi:hypothetical protein [Psychroserpens luteolus]|uniref:hypothetical protein n=1 Tax=Psychroserpens luteolus TaxID=2855840 RepID=UPI001E326166|nr:hypothetical protein [Psychroserpens luteolus]MCD2258183.1 hypothetical protein [Psychroserpens luteolus]
MKKIFLLSFLMFSLFSCNISDDNNPNFYYEALPIESVVIPETFQFGETYEILLTYIKPTDCHVYNNLFYESDLNQRDIAIVTAVFPDNGCNDLNEEEEVSFNFKVTNTGTYTFRFWQGNDESGLDTYLIVEVPVEE